MVKENKGRRIGNVTRKDQSERKFSTWILKRERQTRK